MTPWCDDLVCSWRRLLADRHSLPFPWTLSLHRQWCPSASRHPVTFLFLRALTVPLPCPFPTLGLSFRRPRCPSASHHSFPSHSLGRLCQRSPRTCPVSLLRVKSTQRKANAFAVGQVRPRGHPQPAVRYTHGGEWGATKAERVCRLVLPVEGTCLSLAHGGEGRHKNASPPIPPSHTLLSMPTPPLSPFCGPISSDTSEHPTLVMYCSTEGKNRCRCWHTSDSEIILDVT